MEGAELRFSVSTLPVGRGVGTCPWQPAPAGVSHLPPSVDVGRLCHLASRPLVYIWRSQLLSLPLKKYRCPL